MSRRSLVVLSFYALLTLVLTLPLTTDMNGTLAGYSTDVHINPWADWWTREALTKGLDFYRTDYMFYPQGVSLVFHSFSHANSAVSLLLMPVLGRIAAYNVTVLLAYVLSAYSMYLLASYLTGCPPAAFVAGFVFAFCPYHMFESAHPVLVTTQWIPLFVLALIRMLRDTGASRVKQLLLAAWWFLLTALSSWHLMIMLFIWTVAHMLHGVLSRHTDWAPGAARSLLILAIVTAVLVSPFLWPVIQEQLCEDTAYMAVSTEAGLGNDLASFLIPNRRHPVLGSFFADIHERIGFTRKRPAYLGYVSLILAIVGSATGKRKIRFWVIATILFLGLSLGSRVTLSGTPLHSFDLPWAIPIIAVLRHPFRLSILLFFSLAILTGFGSRWAFRWLAARNPPLAYVFVAIVTGLILFEYLVHPFPVTQVLPSSRFFAELAQEEGDFAVADFPMGRDYAKRYLFYQMIHGKKLVGGVVSRTPDDAYAFVNANPLLGTLRAGEAPDADLEIGDQFAVLALQGIRYVIVHKHLLTAGELASWREKLADFPSPSFEDESLIVYQTPRALHTEGPREDRVHRLDAQLGDRIRLLGYRVDSIDIRAGDALTVLLLWQPDDRLTEDYHVFLHLLDGDGKLVAQHDGVPSNGERSTWTWRGAEVIQDVHVVFTDPGLSSGTYSLFAGMYDLLTGVRLPAKNATGERLSEDRIPLESIQVTLPSQASASSPAATIQLRVTCAANPLKQDDQMLLGSEPIAADRRASRINVWSGRHFPRAAAVPAFSDGRLLIARGSLGRQ